MGVAVLGLVPALLALSATAVSADGNHDAPHFSDASTTMTVRENSRAGTRVGEVSASDYEYPLLDRCLRSGKGARSHYCPYGSRPLQGARHNDTVLLYSLEGADKRFFRVERFAGVITTRARAKFDYESGRPSYSVAVRAENLKGESDTIDVTINVVDVKERSGPPLYVQVSPNPDSKGALDVSWTSPSLRGGPDIIGYRVQYRKASGGQWFNVAHNGTDTSTNLRSGPLEPGTEYLVRVKADNGERRSQWSARGRGTTAAADDS